MRYALIMAGGSGTRLWPMSRAALPKQLIPFIGGKSLLAIAFDRFDGFLPANRRLVCAGQAHGEVILSALPGLAESQFLAEPMGRDTLNAVGLGAAVLAQRDADAVIGVFTADHIIEPIDRFQAIVAEGYELVERRPNTLVTFGITPTYPATGYGYLELDEPVLGTARRVRQFREKPPAPQAEQYVAAGPDGYLWNSGMFVWRASTLLDCIGRYEPEVAEGLRQIAMAWDTPRRQAVLNEIYPTLKKTSVDFAVMEPASKDDKVQVAAIPMPLRWLDVGSWPSLAETCEHDAHGNALGGGKQVLTDCENCLAISSDPEHVVAVVGCRDLIVVHTPEATLVCRAESAEQVKDVQRRVQAEFGARYT